MFSSKITTRCLTGVAVGLLAPEALCAVTWLSTKPARKVVARPTATGLLMHSPWLLLVDFACGVFQNHVGYNCGIRGLRQVRAEADAYVKGPVEVQVDGRAELVHRFALQAYEQGEGVALFFDADTLCEHRHQAVRAGAARPAAAANAKLHVFYTHVFFRALSQLDHARTVQGDDR